MPQLLVRDVDPKLIERLKKRAASNGRSAEAEHRLILSQALEEPQKIPFSEALRLIPAVGNDDDFSRKDDDGRRDVFD